MYNTFTVTTALKTEANITPKKMQ